MSRAIEYSQSLLQTALVVTLASLVSSIIRETHDAQREWVQEQRRRQYPQIE